MSSTALPTLLQLLSHELRWELVQRLLQSDYRVQELVQEVGQPMNLLSYHLKLMRDDGLLSARRSEADGRDIYYSLNLERLTQLYAELGAALHPALDNAEKPRAVPSGQPMRVLFICTHNSARSQMAEGLMRALASERVEVNSAGSQPTSVHPDCIGTMDALGIDIRAQYSKPLSDFDGHAFDYVITVCDRAREVCPVFPAVRRTIHWGFPDPLRLQNPQEREQACHHIAGALKTRIEYFLAASA